MRVIALLLALSGAANAVNIRVLITSAPTVRVRVPFTTPSAYPTNTAPTVTYAEWDVNVAGKKLTLGGQDAGSNSLYLPPAPGSVVGIDGREYRGGVLLRVNGSNVEAVNVLDVEDYLRGVVPHEMPASWPIEALKAQAVIARSYAVARINPAGAYDLCATQQCQVYGGLAKEHPSTDLAVQQTNGQVVSFAGKVAKTYFSADSGGYTASAGEVWGNDLPYLVAQPDPVSRSPKSSWNMTLPLSQIQDVAARYKIRVGTLQSVTATRISVSGRVLELTFTGTGGAAKLQGAEAGGFIRALGAYSARVTLSGQDPVTIAGAGFGHGVGLSQWGANGLAGLNWNYTQILAFYYPGVSLSALQERAALEDGRSVVALGASKSIRPGVLDSLTAALPGTAD